VLAGVIMPDHAHGIVSPIEDRGLSVGDFSTGFKESVAENAWFAEMGMATRMF
jgi:hypothetical protein